MKTTARNDLCPCGSGKKYKKCHGAIGIEEPQDSYQNIRRIEGEATTLLLGFAKKRFGDIGIERAWDEYHFFDETPLDLAGPEQDAFVRWFTFNWIPEDTETLPELFLRLKGTSVSADIQSLIEATIRRPYSFFQVTDTEPGRALTLRDIFLKEEHRVEEQTASLSLRPGDILHARTVELHGIWFIMGCGSRIIPAIELDILIDAREAIENELGLGDGGLTLFTLLAYEEDFRELYFEIVDDLDSRHLEIRNTDGDPLEFHTLTYSIVSSVEAFHAFKDLQQKVSKMSDEDILTESETGEHGEEPGIFLHWLRKGYKNLDADNTTLGTLRIAESTMVVEVNSEKRSKRIQKEIKKRMGGDAVLLKEEIRSHEGLMDDIENKRDPAPADDKSEHDRILEEHPEVADQLRTMMQNHWAKWPDTPVPALRGLTPRAAALDSTGRELLQSLLMDFELRNAEQEDPLLLVDIPKLRRELGLEDK